MKNFILLLFSFCLLSGGAGPAAAGNTVQQTVSFQAEEIYELAFAGDLSFVIDQISVDDPYMMVPDEKVQLYHVTFNNPAYISARLVNNMPEFSLIKVQMEAPPGETSYGMKELNYFDSGFPNGIQHLVYIGDYARAANLHVNYKLEVSIYVPPGTYQNTIEFLVGGW